MVELDHHVATPSRPRRVRLAALVGAVIALTGFIGIASGSGVASAQAGRAQSGALILVGANICTLTTATAGDHTVALTAGHCGRVGDTVTILKDPSSPIGRISRVDSGRDIATIKLYNRPTAARTTAAPAIGGQACVATVDLPSSCGTVASSTTPGRFWLRGACTVPGFSGAPIVDQRHRVIGIVKGSFTPIPCLSPVAGITLPANL